MLMDQWLVARDWLLPAIDLCHGTQDENTVFVQLLAKTYKLWLFQRSAIVTEFQCFPTGLKLMHWFLVGGDKDEIKSMESPMIEFARANGCGGVSNAGREGWKRELAPMGYEYSCTVLFKRI